MPGSFLRVAGILHAARLRNPIVPRNPLTWAWLAILLATQACGASEKLDGSDAAGSAVPTFCGAEHLDAAPWHVVEATADKITFEIPNERLGLRGRAFDSRLQRTLQATLTTAQGTLWDEYYQDLRSRLAKNLELGILWKDPGRDVGTFDAYASNLWNHFIDRQGRAYFECAAPAQEEAPNTRCRGFVFGADQTPSAYVEFSSAGWREIPQVREAVVRLARRVRNECDDGPLRR